MLSKKKIIKIGVYGFLWLMSMILLSNELIEPYIALIVGLPSGVMFMRETRVVEED